jgi:sugar phosphate permease
MLGPTSRDATGYRWIVLFAFFLLTVAISVQWLTFAPIAREARDAYGVSALQIDLLSLIFLVLFVVVCIPASYLIDRYGIRRGIGIGAVLTLIFGLAKGVFASSYAAMFVCQVGLGIAQPFILNGVTKLALNWFPLRERATAVGLATLAQFVGFIVVNLAAPHLLLMRGGAYDLTRGLMAWGVFSALSAVAFLLLVRERPDGDSGAASGDERAGPGLGVRAILRQRDAAMTVVLFFNGLGIFNAIATCIDQICEMKTLTSEQTGTIMGTMFVAAVLGALVMPPLSDRLHRRKPFLVGAMALAAPSLAVMTVFKDYGPMLASSAMVGFSLLGMAGPIGFQYAAEVCHPAPEALSQGVVLLAGQISGILFVLGMNAVGVTPFLFLFVILMSANVVLAARLNESKIVRAGGAA